MPHPPARTCDYIGPVTDTQIWDAFALRSDDIILSTPPKCGTTWSQAIIMMLIHGRAETDRPVWYDSHWLDCGFRDQVVTKGLLDDQTHRRCIKSHTPFDGIPFDPDVTYLTVYRHPIDVHFSLQKHVENMVSDILDFMYPGSPGAAFERFLTAPASRAGTDDLSLASLVHHYRSFRAWSQLPNVHCFHYADLRRNTPGTIKRYAAAMNMTVSDTFVDEIAQASSFSSMKEVTRHNQRSAGKGAFVDETKFFDSASSNKWQGRLTEQEMKDYHARFAELATPAEIAWLERGDQSI
ncbi:sulfotransferase domain-containing protein [Roseobacter weihaiensis]|uniref:sulfotransferase domain-containing protein n=1 Tax=Roseobacter weihaiensis TaxID=2763262 RepID=UPI001D0B781E|nr:sulfotransferase domain-containing protein [Roseobacter sp. H9]